MVCIYMELFESKARYTTVVPIYEQLCLYHTSLTNCEHSPKGTLCDLWSCPRTLRHLEWKEGPGDQTTNEPENRLVDDPLYLLMDRRSCNTLTCQKQMMCLLL
ncbi:unnamed protein product [Pleuronectes platessa]|uniref:Uncharacterized protein n=1 Tax=Pleuronectes platessa TaxID=8262 RepID=A0A9N7UVJ5_PLEPL|nr:unnamed protein product [Pleuronectes platessa]